jgi:hypothetical protein
MNSIWMTRSRQTLALLFMMVSVVASVEQGTAIAGEKLTATHLLAQQTQLATATISPAVVTTLRQDLSQRTGIPANQLRFIEVSTQNWPDGCLGLAQAGQMCTQAIVPGWRVTFANGNRRWVYRTNQNGSNFRLETPASGKQASMLLPTRLQPTQIPLDEMPPRLQQDVMFRAIATGGFAGRTYQTTLYRNGRIVRAEIDLTNNPRSPQVKQVSPQTVQKFMALVRQNQLFRLHRANYLPTPGSADFITTTLSCQSCTVRYADSIQSQLPANLQAVIQAWNELTRTI